MNYDIRLLISYAYDSPAVGGRQMVCMMPLDSAGQRVLSGRLDIAPAPEERLDRRDFFGNALTEFSFRAPHDSLTLTLHAQVQRDDPLPLKDATLLADLPAALARCRDLGPESPMHFLSPSVRVPRDAAITAFAGRQLRPGMTVAQAVAALSRALHRHMHFDPEATDVNTPATVAFAQRRGVCQDYSHIMIAGLRGIGVPAGYVSGFLRTLPPPGKPRLEGADAMHAWVRAWCGPDAGWLDIDPTNDRPAGADHITVARGRDYSDVSPIKGTLRTAGGQLSRQAVDVVPMAP